MRRDPQIPTTLIILFGSILLLILLSEPSLAQQYDIYGRRIRPPANPFAGFWWGVMRFAMIVCSAGAGFALGWFLSPQARPFRLVLLALAGFLVIMIATFDASAMGWSMTFIASTIAFFVALGYWGQRVIKALGEVPSTFGSAKWAGLADITSKGLSALGGLRLGLFEHGETSTPIAYHGDRHGLTVAPTRSGKGVSQIIPNLLSTTASIIVVDPKGENALITAEARRAMGQDVHIVDPWGIASAAGTASRFNPLEWLQLGDTDITENAMLLADAIVVQDGESDPFFNEEAKALLQGIILYVATDEHEDGQRHLGRVRDLTLLDGEDLPQLFQRMAGSPHHVVASCGARSLQKDPKLLSNVLASAQAHTHFLDSARIRESLSTSDFTFEDVKAKPMSIFLVLPADRLHGFKGWLRLIIQQAITVNARNIADKPAQPVLFLLDEMPALGRLTMIEQAYGLMAGFGIQLWGIVQDLSQLKSTYDDGWETFIGNSGMIQYFGSRDRMTAEYFSALCGETTVWNFSSALSKAFGTSSGNGSVSSSQTTTTTDTRAASQRKLAYPDELMRLPGTRQIVFIENMDPIIAAKVPWFEDDALKAKGVNLHAE
ncbi:MAG: type IV secretory system conjugative DNA transfer family protein [Pseudomonadota bacterium]